MTLKLVAESMSLLAVVLSVVFAVPDSQLPAVKAIKNVTLRKSALDAAQRENPLVVKSVKEAEKCFDEESLAALKKQVNFCKQVEFVFAWEGSGDDQLDFNVLESFPEQVSFRLQQCRTKDLKHHVRIYALRSDVKWRNQ